MNMKLLTGLAVVIALVSAMTFVGAYGSNRQATQAPANPETQGSATSVIQNPPEDTTTGSAAVRTSVEVGGDDVQTSVTIK